ncbi:MAG TPA: bacteriohopanetetrol glucosamine biosynthesis glycosyltransferase HpnI [Candidatus Sulfotelmatobacter sp.]
MIHFFVTIVRVVGILGCGTSSAYYLLCLWSAVSFHREQKTNGGTRPTHAALPPVSILKPLKGTDPENYQSFRSHCVQDYPEYEIVFGVSDSDDPAVKIVQDLRREFPEARIRLVVCPEILGANRKVSSLAQMLPEARYSYLVVNDSDVRVDPDYLRNVIGPLLDDEIGMVTCLYRGLPAWTLGSRLESLGIASDFCPGVLAAKKLESGLRFGLGSTMAFRRSDLERIGGFESVADYLADDYELGKRISDLGLRVKLSKVVVETFLPAYDIRGFFAHQLRWARGMRNSRPGGYFGLIFTFGLVWAVLCVLATTAAFWSWGLLFLIVLLRCLMAAFVDEEILHGHRFLCDLWLLPVRDMAAAAVWLASYAGNTVTWRGERFGLKNGKLTRYSASQSSN